MKVKTFTIALLLGFATLLNAQGVSMKVDSKSLSTTYVAVSTTTPAIETTWSKGDSYYIHERKLLIDDVQVWSDDSQVGDTKATYTPPTSLSKGLHTSVANGLARYYYNNTTNYTDNAIYTGTFNFFVDTQSPSGNLELIGKNATITASDDAGLQKIELLANTGSGYYIYNTITIRSAPSKYGSGVYNYSSNITLPSTGGTYPIKARMYDFSNKSTETAPITITKTSVIISPSDCSILPSSTQKFSAAVSGLANTTVTWSATSGSIDSTGLYTAPSVPGDYTIKAIASDGTVGSAVARVHPIVRVTPSNTTIKINGTLQLTASVTGSSNQNVSWSATGGSISSSGLYTAPSSIGSFTITARSVIDSTAKATASITVSALTKTKWVTQQGGPFNESQFANQKWVSGDFNGDGRCDIACVWNDYGYASIDAYMSTGTSFSKKVWATKQGGPFTEAQFSTQKWIPGDFNGDGLCDIACVYNDLGYASIENHMSNGSSFTKRHWALKQGGPFSDQNFNEQKWVSGDFNGDRLCDIACVYNESNQASIELHLSNGSSFWNQHWARRQGGFWSSQNWFVGDFNGDNLDDIANAFSDGSYDSIEVHQSTGSAFTNSRWSDKQNSLSSFECWISGNFNGDNKSDIVFIKRNGTFAALNIGMTATNAFNWYLWADTQGGYFGKWVCGDFTGDGIDEAAVVYFDSNRASIELYLY